jgi:hypothetical protein
MAGFDPIGGAGAGIPTANSSSIQKKEEITPAYNPSWEFPSTIIILTYSKTVLACTSKVEYYPNR